MPRSTSLSLTLAVVVVLAGCGSGSKSAVGTASTSSTAAPSGTVAPATSLPGSPATTTSSAPTTVVISPTATTRPVVTTRPTVKTTTTTRPPNTGSRVVQLTSADRGQTFQVAVGDVVELTLDDPGMRWGPISYTPTGLLQGDPSPSPPVNGQRLVWTAVRPGSVVISSTESAVCTPPLMCPDVVMSFVLHLVIT